jgi:hypothetical protein
MKSLPTIESAFIFEHGLKEAEMSPGDKDLNRLRFLCRYCATFPEAKPELFKYDLRHAYDGATERFKIVVWAESHPLAEPSTLEFLRQYLPEESALRKMSLSKCALHFGWITGDSKPDHMKVKNILRRFSIKHGKVGQPGRPKKRP